MWMDRNPVHQLSSGGSRQLDKVQRRVDGEQQQVPTPDLARDYHWCQRPHKLRKQRYSVYLSYKSRKYYRTLVLGLLQMALVYEFIVHRYQRQVNNRCPPKKFAVFEELMEQLLAGDSAEAFRVIAEATSAKGHTATSPARSDPTLQRLQVAVGHRLEENPDTVDCELGLKRGHRSCKACAIYKVKPRKFTKYFGPECYNGTNGRTDTCFRIWHADRNNGSDITRDLVQEHKPRDRPPAPRPGKKRRRRAPSASTQSAAASGENGGNAASDDDEGAADDEA
ncbi:hypothetical protein PC128_g12752 [Phytophthora cactorum]|nr:hypothetical protein PC128_g12752 [Phytophthora cactorum]